MNVTLHAYTVRQSSDGPILAHYQCFHMSVSSIVLSLHATSITWIAKCFQTFRLDVGMRTLAMDLATGYRMGCNEECHPVESGVDMM